MFQPVRGTSDVLPEEYRRRQLVVQTAQSISELYDYEAMDTPIFEFAPVFQHIGETSDIVTKETYTFEDRGGNLLTLRPEGTASVVRAVISNGLTQQIPLKYFYAGPMFRYERPQKGRYRQFHQIGIELLGVEQPLGDVEVIALGHHIIETLNLSEGVTLEINTLGDLESRENYRKVLIDYLQDYRGQLSEDSQTRLERNPLRVLDSKDRGDLKIIQNAPLYRDHLNDASEDFFAQVLKHLDILGIRYNLNYRIVRGIDYYSHTAFEFVSDALGAQGAVLAGGRYNRLASMMGGPDIQGVGWAAGIERLAMLLSDKVEKKRPIAVIPIGQEAEMEAVKLSQELRHQGHCVDLGYTGALTKRLKKANKRNARIALIFGEDELKSGQVQVRHLDSGEQSEIGLSQLTKYLSEKK